METAIRRGTTQVTVVCLVASAIVLSLGLVGATATPVLVGLLLVLAAALYRTRPDTAVGLVAGVDIDGLLETLWLAPAIAAVPLVLELGATPAEMQALGGLLGLAGMVNYFLRPLYLVVYSVVATLARVRDGSL
jgi:hypothetical protein